MSEPSSSPRYDARLRPSTEPHAHLYPYAVYDTHTEAFVIGAGHFRTLKVAQTQARLYSEAWQRTRADVV
jgi:hypothetical protein